MRKTHKGFTLIEMLLVIGIIAVLVGASLASASKMMKSADKTKAQELVIEAATALAAIYNSEGTWPKAISSVNKDTKNGVLGNWAGCKTAFAIARRGYLTLSMDGESLEDAKKLVGRDRYGVLTPWGAKKLASEGNLSEDEAQKNALRFAVDLDGDGIIKAAECGNRTGVAEIRAAAVVWCPMKGKEGSSEHKDWIMSWTKGQETKVQ